VVVHPAPARSKSLSADPPLDRTLAALADPTRRAVIDLLSKGPRQASELAGALSMSAAALSRHLRILRTHGLVAGDGVEHDARVRMYRLVPGAFVPLRDWVGAVEAFWDDQLQAFKTHAEGPRGRRKQ
jgi:DNA-binding transcriptional ArsR family regulator